MSMRKEKVYTILRQLTVSSFENSYNAGEKIGFDASFIGEKLGICRNNVSKELNCLFNEGKIIKVKGKPVLYMDKLCFEEKLNIKIPHFCLNSYEEFTDMCIGEKLQDNSNIGSEALAAGESTMADQNIVENKIKNVFDSMIGVNLSLELQIEQAKAAILYPPLGLHTLIIGSTGVGKTTFAEAMYYYALEVKRIEKDKRLIIFNCADYAENPQFLISQLFGHVKGSFTGAEKEKEGLVDQANGGILFLDEVHRLPPEGQEMLFSLMDKGTYRRLGEASNLRNASVLIILATTEDPSSSILHTFLRRIPMIIKLPDLKDRTAQERALLICSLFQSESKRLRLPIKVNREVLKGFLYYQCSGNIGQLKSDIQFVCARAFLNYMEQKNGMIEVRLSHLSKHVKDGLFRIIDQEQEFLSNTVLRDNKDLVFDNFNPVIEDSIARLFSSNSYKGEETFYDTLSNTWETLCRDNMPNKKIKDIICQQIDEYFKDLFLKSKYQSVEKDKMNYSILRGEVFEAVKYGLSCIGDLVDIQNNKGAAYNITLHISHLMDRIICGNSAARGIDSSILKQYPNEYEAAVKFKTVLEDKLSIVIPQYEITFFTMFFYAYNRRNVAGSVDVLVVCYGEQAATSIADVANEVLGISYVRAVDVPLNQKAEEIFCRIVEKVKQFDNNNGVLMLVDEEGISYFSELIEEETGKPVRCIEMVSTAMVIEAARMALVAEFDLEQMEKAIRGTKNTGDNYSLYGINYGVEQSKAGGTKFFTKLLIGILDKTLTFLNPRKSCMVLTEVLTSIMNDLGKSMDEDIVIKFLFHCSCMIERAIRNEPFQYKHIEEYRILRRDAFDVIDRNFELIEDVFGIKVCEQEKAYIVEMFDAHFDTDVIHIEE